jgi:LysR family cys regulon transcriptional activator
MNLRQLRALCEIVDNDFKISHAAKALYTSQPSVSRHISSLEEEVGAALFRRTDKRIIGLTEAGADILSAARRMLNDAENIKKIGQDHSDENHGELTIAASHTTARYFLPGIVTAFMAKHPSVRLVIRQSDPTQVARLVNTGEVDLSLSPAGAELLPEVVMIPCHEHGRIILVPTDHPLLRIRKPTLAQVAKFPLITYSREFPAYAQIMGVFDKAKLAPNVVLTASDIDVMKTYVECGLGIAIVASFAYDSVKDVKLRAVNVDHLIAPATVYICLRRGGHIRSYVYDFIELVSSSLTRKVIAQATFSAKRR